MIFLFFFFIFIFLLFFVFFHPNPTNPALGKNDIFLAPQSTGISPSHTVSKRAARVGDSQQPEGRVSTRYFETAAGSWIRQLAHDDW